MLIPASSSSGWSTSDGNAKNVLYNNNTTNGAYYTWCAATAGTCVNSGTASSSVCPKGWKLPSLSEYQNFLTKADINYQHYNGSSWSGSSSASDSTKIRGVPYNFPYAGRVYNGALNNVGSYGYYWSRTAYDSSTAYGLSFDSTSAYTNYDVRYLGFSVRCIAL